MAEDGAMARVITTGFDQLREQTPVKEGQVAPSRLFSNDDARVMHLVLDEGTELKEHTAPAPILVQVFEGHIRFDVEGDSHDLGPGGMIYVAEAVPHAVTALGVARILIILLDPRSRVHR